MTSSVEPDPVSPAPSERPPAQAPSATRRRALYAGVAGLAALGGGDSFLLLLFFSRVLVNFLDRLGIFFLVGGALVSPPG